MKIDHIETINLRFEYPEGGGFRYSGGICTARVTTVVLVHTDTGHTGIGSCYTHPGLAHLVIDHQLAPLLLGRDPRDVEALWSMMHGLTLWYGRKGAAMSAIGALDTAFWDLRGKSLDKPVRQLLRPEAVNACPAYASALLWTTDMAALAREASGHVERGFRRMKLRLGMGEERDLAAVRAVRQAIGSTNDLMVDAGMRLHVNLARRMAKTLAECRVFWFEEPFEPEAIDLYAALRGSIDVPIAAGENEFGLAGFRELIRAKAVDIVQPDVSRCGGITEGWRVVQLAEQARLRVAPHTWSDAVAVVANAQMVAATPGGITVEMDQTGNPFIEALLVEPLRVKDGMLQLSNAPGLGIELDHAVVERHRMVDPLRVPHGRYSDMTFGAPWFTPAGPYVEVAEAAHDGGGTP